MDQERFARAIGKAVADRNAHSLAERETIYAAARAALARKAVDRPDASAALEAAIAAVEAAQPSPPAAPEEAPAPAPGPAAAAPPARIGPRLRQFLAFGAGAVLGALAVAVATAIVAASGPDTNDAGKLLEARYRKTLPQIPVAVEFLHKVSDAVIDMQKKDRAGLEAKAGKNFIGLAALSPDLVRQMPKTLPPGSAVIVKADGFDFKVLFNWTLCGAVGIAKPEMVDRVRSKADVVGCPNFGIWTTGAAGW